MTEKETKEAEQGLNIPKSDEELFDAINAAVSSGNQGEVDRLMAVELPAKDSIQTDPDATDDDDKSSSDPAHKAGDEKGESSSDDPNKESSKTSDTPEAAPDAASVKKEPTTAELLAEIQGLKSAAGRVGYLQTRLTQLEREQAAARKQKQAKPKEETAPAPRKSDERLTKLKDIDPDMAETLELLREEMRQDFEKEYGKPTPQTNDDESDDEMQQEIARIERVHPETRQIFWGQYRPMWDQWKNSLTPEQRAWAESDKAEEVVVALTAFKQSVSQAPSQQPAPDNKGGDPIAQEAGGDVDETNKARERKLQGGTGSKNTTIKTQGVPDRDKLFSEMYEKIQKEDHLT